MSLLRDITHGTFHCIKYLDTNDCSSAIGKLGIQIRKLISPLMRLIYRTQSTYKIIVEDCAPLLKSKNGIIFVVNHRQSDDMVFSAVAAGTNGWFVFGNPVLLFESLKNGFGLWANGVILLRRNDKENRHAACEKMRYILKRGGNVIIFPEGYWNLDDDGQSDSTHGADGHNSENWLIQDFNIGAFRLARETGAIVVPLVLHYDETGKKRCYAQRGHRISILPSDDVFRKKDEVWQNMVDMMYGMMETHSSYTRAELESGGVSLHTQWSRLKTSLIADCDIPRVDYHLDLAEEKRIGKAKVVNPVTPPEEAFAHLNDLIPSRENAFLFRER